MEGKLERRDPQKRTRKSDKWVPLLMVIGVIVILVVGVMSTLAFVGISKAEDAANTAEHAAESSERASRAAAKNAATVEDLCLIALQQAEENRFGIQQTKDYLKSPAAASFPAFAQYIAEVSLPQAKLRAKNYKVPKGCK